jgi:hypothetical protein
MFFGSCRLQPTPPGADASALAEVGPEGFQCQVQADPFAVMESLADGNRLPAETDPAGARQAAGERPVPCGCGGPAPEDRQGGPGGDREASQATADWIAAAMGGKNPALGQKVRPGEEDDRPKQQKANA